MFFDPQGAFDEDGTGYDALDYADLDDDIDGELPTQALIDYWRKEADLPVRTGSGILKSVNHPLKTLTRPTNLPEVPAEAQVLLAEFESALNPRESETPMPTRKPVLTRANAESLAAEAARQLAAVNRLDAKYGTEPPIGAIIAFQRAFPNGDGRVYSYATLRADDGNWYLTGAAGQRAFEWYELLWWLEEGEIFAFTTVSLNAFAPVITAEAPANGKHEKSE